MSSKESKEKVWNMIKDIKVGMLVTQEDDRLHSRPMQLVQDSYDGTLWFFTKIQSGKTEEVMSEKNVCVAFSNSSEQTHVSLTGKAKLNFDQEKIEELWSPFVAAWFPEGKQSSDMALLEIKVDHGEYWNNDNTSLGYLYEVAKANVSKETPDLGENQKF